MFTRRLSLVWVESVAPGSAPFYHLLGTRRRLMAAGWDESALHIISDSSIQSRTRRLLKVLVLASVAGFRSSVVVCRWHPLLLPCLLVWRLLRRRVVLLVQGTAHDAVSAYPVLRRLPGAQWLMKLSLRLGTAWAAPHPGIADWIVEATGAERTQVAVIPNGYPVHTGTVRESDGASGLPPTYALFAGALAPWQGTDVMLEAVDEPEWPPDVHLVVIGDGPEASKLVGTSSSRVVYLGRRDPETVRLALRRALCSLSPKLLNEVTARGISPFKILEAGLEGVPVIASRVPGQTEYVEEKKCGVLIEPGSARELASAVRSIWDDPARAAELGSRGKKASEEFRWERHAAELANLIDPTRRYS